MSTKPDFEAALYKKAEIKVFCTHCGDDHDVTHDTFFVVYGNITIGQYGGVVGNNFNEDGTLGNAAVFCRNAHCLHNFLHAH